MLNLEFLQIIWPVLDQASIFLAWFGLSYVDILKGHFSLGLLEPQFLTLKSGSAVLEQAYFVER